MKKGGRLEEKKVLKGRSYDGFAFLQLEGVNDRDAAEALRGTEVYVDRKHAIKLGADENFVCELIGLKAVDENGEAIARCAMCSSRTRSATYTSLTQRAAN